MDRNLVILEGILLHGIEAELNMLYAEIRLHFLFCFYVSGLFLLAKDVSCNVCAIDMNDISKCLTF